MFKNLNYGIAAVGRAKLSLPRNDIKDMINQDIQLSLWVVIHFKGSVGCLG